MARVFSGERPTLYAIFETYAGISLFLAGVYSLFGHDKTAVRIIQALMDTATCAMIGILAYFWEPDKRSRQSSSNAAMALAAICPFTAIYTATILTETSTIFFAVAMCLAATMALRSTSRRKALWLWIASGLIASVAVLFRPDSGIFAFAIALTLGVATLSRAGTVKLSGKRDEIGYRPGQTSYLAVFLAGILPCARALGHQELPCVPPLSAPFTGARRDAR